MVAASRMMISKSGTLDTASPTRLMTLSTQPPRYPATSPSAGPMSRLPVTVVMTVITTVVRAA